MESLLQDLRFALRTLAKSPGFTAVAVVTLALSIGASTTVFSVVERLLLHPLPFPNADRIATVWMHDPATDIGIAPALEDAKHFPALHSFDAVEFINSNTWFFEGPGGSTILNGSAITPSLLTTLVVAPILGRPLVATDTLPDAPNVALLGERFWLRAFGGRRDVVGTTIRLDTVPYVVVGVAPERLGAMTGWRPTDIWIPPERSLHAQSAITIVRLRRGVSELDAKHELSTLFADLERERPRTDYRRRLTAEFHQPGQLGKGSTRQAILMIAGAVALLLLIACANLANLLLARATGRAREIALRQSLGAGRRRLIRQLLTESIVLSTLGATAGLGLSAWAMAALASFHPRFLDQLEHLSIDARVLGFTIMVSVGTGIAFGLLPALQATSLSLHDVLKGGSGSRGGRRARLPFGLVTAELALTTSLLFAGGLLIRTLLAEERADPGFRADGLVALKVNLPRYRFMAAASRTPFWSELLQRARAIPQVDRVRLHGSASTHPGFLIGTKLEVEGRELGEAQQSALAARDLVAPGFFETFGIPILEGRAFSETEYRTNATVAVINRSMAKRLWPGANPLGKRFRLGFGDSWTTVIGVVRDEPSGAGYLTNAVYQVRAPVSESTGSEWGSWVIVRTTPNTNPGPLLTTLRGLVKSVDSSAVVETAATVPALLDARLADSRFTTTLLEIFGLLALAIAVVGLFGVLSYRVAQRTREIGIRVALGARPTQVVADVIGHGLLATAAGLALGIGLGLATSRFFSALLYGTSVADWRTMAGVTGILALAAVTASWLPARRAAKVDPMVALRYE